MKRQIKAGSTSVILGDIFILDATKTDGSGLSGLLFNSAGLTCYYHRNTGSASVAVTLASMTLGSFTSGGFKEVDATNMKGIYSFCPPDAALAAGAQTVTFYFQGAANMAPVPLEVELTGFNLQDSKLSADALDNLGTADPGSPASMNTITKMIVGIWRSIYKKKTLTSTQGKFYADNGTSVNATASVSDDGTTQTWDAMS